MQLMRCETYVSQQEDGADGETVTLRMALQAFEKKGIVDYVVGGHQCVRPPGVQQGKEDDRFSVSPDPDNTLVWKPNNINTKSIKAANVASCFPWPALEESPLEIAACLVS